MRDSRLFLFAGLIVASCLVKGMDVDPALDGFGASGASSAQAGSSGSGSPGGGSSAGGTANGEGAAAAGDESGGHSGSLPSGGTAGSGVGGSGTSGDGGSQVGGSAGSATTEPSEGCDKVSAITFGPVPGEPPNGFGEGGYVTLQSGTATRGFALRLPDNYDSSQPYPLIFGFHWNGGAAKDVDSGGANGYESAHYGLQKMSNNGAIFVAPDGLSGAWADTDGRDLQFVDDMLALIQASYCVDKKRIFANGFSYGGSMTHALACARASVFRGVAIYSGGQFSGCQGGTDPVPYWIMGGIEDGTVSLNLVKVVRDRFLTNNGCTVPAVEPAQPPAAPPYLNPGGHTCTDYAGCSSGFPVRWCVHQSGHTAAPVDGTSDLSNMCAAEPDPCSAGCPCSWVPQDVWAFFTSL